MIIQGDIVRVYDAEQETVIQGIVSRAEEINGIDYVWLGSKIYTEQEVTKVSPMINVGEHTPALPSDTDREWTASGPQVDRDTEHDTGDVSADEVPVEYPEAIDMRDFMANDPVATTAQETFTATLQQQNEKGLMKYGTALSDADLSVYELLQHLNEELVDAYQYKIAIMQRLTDTVDFLQGLNDPMADTAVEMLVGTND